jgi:hypothetical protein
MILPRIATSLALLALLALAAAQEAAIGSRHEIDPIEAEESLRAVDAALGSGRLYFTGTGYTVNLIPHAIVLGLLALGVVFLFGDSLFGADVSGSGYGAPAVGYGAPEAAYGAPAPSYSAPAPSYAAAPATGYDAANRYYDTYAQQAASGLGSASS